VPPAAWKEIGSAPVPQGAAAVAISNPEVQVPINSEGIANLSNYGDYN